MPDEQHGVGGTGYATVATDPAAESDIARNIRVSHEQQVALAKGALDPTKLNDAASEHDPTAVASREGRAERRAQHLLSVGGSLPELMSAHNDFVDHVMSELDRLNGVVIAAREAMNSNGSPESVRALKLALSGEPADPADAVYASYADHVAAYDAGKQSHKPFIEDYPDEYAALKNEHEAGPPQQQTAGGVSTAVADAASAVMFELGGPSDDPRDVFEGGTYDRNDPRRPSAQVERTASQAAETSNPQDRVGEIERVQAVAEPSADVAAPVAATIEPVDAFDTSAEPLHEAAPRNDQNFTET